jgi:hypothetical protein
MLLSNYIHLNFFYSPLFLGNLTEKTPQVNKKIPPKGSRKLECKNLFLPSYFMVGKNGRTDIPARGGSAFGGPVCSVRQVPMNVRIHSYEHTQMSDLTKKIFVVETFRFPYFWIKKMEG